MFKEAIAFEPLEVQRQRARSARLLRSCLQVNAALCSYDPHLRESPLGFRRSSESVEAVRVWRRFLDAEAALLREAALPSAVTESRERWDDFLMHGYLDHHEDPSRFTVRQLDEAQYRALVQLTAAYLEAFYARGERAATPIALRTADQDALRARFAALR